MYESLNLEQSNNKPEKQDQKVTKNRSINNSDVDPVLVKTRIQGFVPQTKGDF